MRRRQLLVVLAAVAALGGGLALPASRAFAAVPQLTASPSTSLDGGTVVQLTLSGADADNGDLIQFVECNEAYAATQQGVYTHACGHYQPSQGVTIANGTATVSYTVTYGVLDSQNAPNASCTEADNGDCDIVVFDITKEEPNIASTPITFEAPPPPVVPVVTAAPSTGLDDGDTVAVSVANIPDSASATVEIYECNTSFADQQGCKYLTEGAVADHAYSTSVHVTYGAVFAGDGVRCDETTTPDCVIEAYDPSNERVIATTPISFEAPPIVYHATPNTGLKDGDSVSVTASGIPSEDNSLEVRQCNTAYAAAHGGFGTSLPGCDYAAADQVRFVNHSLSTHITVVDNRSEDGTSACTHATNGDCAIILFRYDSSAGYSVLRSQAITFRPPVTGPATIVASPTTRLHQQSPVTVRVTAADIPDNIAGVDIMECNIAELAARNAAVACGGLARPTVVGNSIPPQKLKVPEGFVGTDSEAGTVCDHSHACELGMFSDSGKQPRLISNLVRLSYRNPNVGTPVMTLSSSRRLKAHQSIDVKVSKIPDLTRDVELVECNVKVAAGNYDEAAPCFEVSRRYLTITNNTGRGTATAHIGLVGYKATNHGSVKEFCTSKTNGQCAIVAILNPGRDQRLLAKVPITFAKTKKH